MSYCSNKQEKPLAMEGGEDNTTIDQGHTCTYSILSKQKAFKNLEDIRAANTHPFAIVAPTIFPKVFPKSRALKFRAAPVVGYDSRAQIFWNVNFNDIDREAFNIALTSRCPMTCLPHSLEASLEYFDAIEILDPTNGEHHGPVSLSLDQRVSSKMDFTIGSHTTIEGIWQDYE
jgi:hypothetical protein